jgi:glycosyltransferase involved in cell wall biosynthesis
MSKKKILLQTDFSLAKTGFGRNAKSILSHLYKSDKYDIVHYCCGIPHGHPHLSRTPWRSLGCLPNDERELNEIRKDPNFERLAGYGAYYLDKVIAEEKPDVYIATQDIWGVDFAINKPWFNKINSVIWTTLDSLPILPSAIEAAKKVKNYWIWSSFATKELNKLGYKNVETVHGAVDKKSFFRLRDHERKDLRKRFSIDENAFVVGFVFRNQLRKSAPNLLEGYKMWKQSNPEAKNTRLLLHTHFGEGWNILKLADEYQIDKNEILTTYICKGCLNYEIKPFRGQDLKCKFCSADKAQMTTNVGLGISEEELNEVYNLMDVYVHPFTSGGQEIPIQEAKYTELITLVTNYSCGEEMCEEEAASLPLDWSEYREHGTEFRKASTYPLSIAKQINKVFKMRPQERRGMGEKAREWTIKNFSVENIGGLIEKKVDSFPEITSDAFEIKTEEKDPNCKIDNIEDDGKWILSLYKNILRLDGIDENDNGYKYWMNEIQKGAKREDIENFFRQQASKDNQKNKKVSFEGLLSKDDNGKRILFVIPESAGDIFMSTSLFKCIKDSYPDHNLYVATKPEYFDILDGNPYVFKVLNYIPQMDNLLWLEGAGEHQGFFEVAYLAHAGTQRFLNYLHNGKDKIAFDLKYAHS